MKSKSTTFLLQKFRYPKLDCFIRFLHFLRTIHFTSIYTFSTFYMVCTFCTFYTFNTIYTFNIIFLERKFLFIRLLHVVLSINPLSFSNDQIEKRNPKVSDFDRSFCVFLYFDLSLLIGIFCWISEFLILDHF